MKIEFIPRERYELVMRIHRKIYNNKIAYVEDIVNIAIDETLRTIRDRG